MLVDVFQLEERSWDNLDSLKIFGDPWAKNEFLCMHPYPQSKSFSYKYQFLHREGGRKET